MDGQPVFMIQDTARRENQNRPPNHVALYTFPTLDEAMHCEFHLLPDMWYPMPKA